MYWQTIDSAPRDGAEVIVGWPDNPLRQAKMRWDWAYDKKKWCGEGFYWSEGEFGPTHWMPLPEPPKQNGE